MSSMHVKYDFYIIEKAHFGRFPFFITKIWQKFLFFIWDLKSFLSPILDRRERRNPRHPEVGRAPAPDLTKVKSKIGSRDNRKHKPKGGRVQVGRRGKQCCFIFVGN